MSGLLTNAILMSSMYGKNKIEGMWIQEIA